MSTLIVIPTVDEYIYFIQACEQLEVQLADRQIGRLACKSFNEGGLTIACGGLGKVQFGVSTQHLIDCGPEWDVAICAGAAGGLSDALQVGDIVVGTETVEYDIQNHFGPPLMPRFPSDKKVLGQCRSAANKQEWPFGISFGPIASGDQDVVDTQVRAGIIEQTQAIVVAWEGAGGARACQFSQVPFVEIRCISDAADDAAASSYEGNLESVMHNLAAYIWVASQSVAEE